MLSTRGETITMTKIDLTALEADADQDSRRQEPPAPFQVWVVRPPPLHCPLKTTAIHLLKIPSLRIMTMDGASFWRRTTVMLTKSFPCPRSLLTQDQNWVKLNLYTFEANAEANTCTYRLQLKALRYEHTSEILLLTNANTPKDPYTCPIFKTLLNSKL